MRRGSQVEVKLYYKILQPVGGAWKSLMHFDGPLRFNGDHEPIKGRCPTSTWQPGDYVDRHAHDPAGGARVPAGDVRAVDRVLHRLGTELEEHAGLGGAARACAIPRIA